jgi:hypothetical protein
VLFSCTCSVLDYLRSLALEISNDRSDDEHFFKGEHVAFDDVAVAAGEDDVVEFVAACGVFSVFVRFVVFGERSAAVDAICS